MGLTGAALAGCSNQRNSNFTEIVKVLDRVFSDQAFTNADVERTPYATIGVRLGDGAEAMVALATADKDALIWVAADQTVITTRRGRIEGWQGQGVDVRVVRNGSADPVANGQLDRTGAVQCARLLDFPGARLYDVPTKSAITPAGTANVALLYGSVPADLFVEEGRSAPLDWDFRNEFYRDPTTGRTWKSVQSFTPQLPPVTIRVLRPATSDLA